MNPFEELQQMADSTAFHAHCCSLCQGDFECEGEDCRKPLVTLCPDCRKKLRAEARIARIQSMAKFREEVGGKVSP